MSFKVLALETSNRTELVLQDSGELDTAHRSPGGAVQPFWEEREAQSVGAYSLPEMIQLQQLLASVYL